MLAGERMEEVDEQISRELDESLVKFPFIHFTACPACVPNPTSPAAQVHQKMRDLALGLDPAFAEDVEQYAARYKDVREGCFGPFPA